MRSLAAMFAASLLVFACSSTTTTGDGGAAPATTGTSTGGTTQCGTQTCQPGSYCFNGACVPGCLSVSNCTSTEECDKSSGDIGSCKAKTTTQDDSGTPPAVADCETFCKKYEGCDPNGWGTLLGQCKTAKSRTCVCADVCGVLTSGCISCFNKAATCGDANKDCAAACR
jgi:hypothetical protein